MSTTPTTTSERGSLPHHSGETGSAFSAALGQIDRIKLKLRASSGDITEAVSLLKNAQKEKRVSTREIEAVRAKLREIQNVDL